MKNLQRNVGILALLALLLPSVIVFAQDESEITVVGSGIVTPVVEALADATETNLNIDVTGTNTGFESFCVGEVAMTSATRTINAEENTTCIENGVEYFELLIAHEVLTFVTNPDDALTCIADEDLNIIYSPSSTGDVANWADLNGSIEGEDGTYPDLELTALLPADNTLSYLALDNLISGVGFRNDIDSADVATTLETVASTSGAIGVVPLQTALDAGDSINILNVDFQKLGCAEATVTNAEAGNYAAVTSFYLYVNQAEAEALDTFLSYFSTEDITSTIIDAGYSPASNDVYETNIAIIAGEEASGAFSETEVGYIIPAFLTGEFTIGGTFTGFRVASSAVSGVQNTQGNPAQQNAQPAFTINVDFAGEANDAITYCANEAPVLFVNGDGSDFACEGDEAIDSLVLPIGTQTTVLVANEADEFATCLTTEHLATIWGASSTDTIETWNQVAESFPDEAMTLFGINAGNVITDVMMANLADGVVEPIRVDTEINGDSLYRAAAVANVEGALTYMSWVDYQDVLENDQARIQLLGVDAGEGCVFPTEETIADGSYPLSETTSLLVNRDLLSDELVKAFVWTLYSDNLRSVYASAEFEAASDVELADVRDLLLVEFRQADERALEAATTETDTTDETTDTEAVEDTEADATEEAGE